MKPVVFFGIFAFILLTSCKKDVSVRESNLGLLGKWNVITDSSFAGVGNGNHPVNYTGQAGDYFDFNADGKLYIKEKGKLNTSGYHVLSDTTIIIDSFGIMINSATDTSIISSFTTHSVTIITPIIATPGGSFGRKVNLNR